MGEHFGHHRLDELIGRGGMDDVHPALGAVEERAADLAIPAQQSLPAAAPVPASGWSVPPTRPATTSIQPPTAAGDRTTRGHHPPPPQVPPVLPAPEPAAQLGRRRQIRVSGRGRCA